MTKEFSDYLRNSKNKFVDEINAQDWDIKLRVTAEDFIIAYDQAVSELKGKEDGWIKVEDAPLIKKTERGWITTDAGSKDFLAAVPYRDDKKPGELLWWIRHCVIEDERGLCIVGDDDNYPAGWEIDAISHYQPLPQPPTGK